MDLADEGSCKCSRARPTNSFVATGRVPTKSVPTATTVSARRVLLECLAEVLGTERAARAFLEGALRGSGLAQVPRTDVAVLEFVRNHLLGMLEDELGRRDAAGVVRNIVGGLRLRSTQRAASPSTKPKSKRPEPAAPPTPVKRAPIAPSRSERARATAARVALLVADRLRRAGLARELVLARFVVLAPDTVEEVDGAVDVAVADLRQPDVEEMLREVLARGPHTRFVVLAEVDADVERWLGSLGVRSFSTTSPTTRGAALAKLVRQLVDRSPRRARG